MTRAEIILWSLCAGSALSAWVVTVLDVVFNRHQNLQREGVLFMTVAALWTFSIPGLLMEVVPPSGRGAAHIAQVLLGPLVAIVTCFRARFWLFTRDRDQFMDRGLLLLGWGLVAGLGLVLVLPQAWQLAASGMLLTLAVVPFAVIALRGIRLGDWFWLYLLAVAGLFVAACVPMYLQLVQGVRWPLWVQVLEVVALVLAVILFCIMLWQRNTLQAYDERQRRERLRRDPLTQLLNQQGFGDRLRRYAPLQQRKYLRGALVAVSLRGMSGLYRELGQMGVNEVLVHLSARIYRRLGGINAISRWDDNHFLVLIDNVENVRKLEKLVNRTTQDLNQSMTVQGYPAGRVDLLPDVSVGLLLLEDVINPALDVPRAITLAHSARAMDNHCARLSNRDTAQTRAVQIENSGASISPAEAELRG